MQNLTEIVSEVLYNFSKWKLMSFIEIPEFAYLLNNFLHQPFDVRQLKTQLKNEEAQKVYDEQI